MEGGRTMADRSSPHLHASAVISTEAELAPDVRVGASCVLSGAVRLGAGCVLRPGVFLFGPLVLGEGNLVHSGVVLGEVAQHLQGHQPAGLEIGGGNIFQTGVTIHQGTAEPTRIGNGNRFLSSSHIGHDCQVGNACVFGQSALLAGHCVVGDGVRMGAQAAVHQFCRLGRLARLLVSATTTKDVPPFIVQRDRNVVTGLNVPAMRRAGLDDLQVKALRRLFRIVYRNELPLAQALAEVERLLSRVDVVREFLDFVRTRGRGINDCRPSD
jgi:UDP-N-acetylglucosamine acyltransferase